jgi:hypothetical protein
MAGVVDSIGRGGQRWAETRLGWNRQLIHKGKGELDSGVDIVDRVSQRGRKKAEEIHPHLLRDIRAIADPNSQTDPSFRSTRLYVRITASEVHRRLKDRFGYDAERMPCVRTVNSKLNFLKLHPRKVAKSKPLKKIKETDAIFEMVHEINALADSDPRQLRISMDTKATVKIGEFSRGGYRRGGCQALDHDFKADATLVPFGIYQPYSGETDLWFSESKVTADFMVDRLEELWPRLASENPDLEVLVINADNGPESSGSRTQWLKRLAEFAAEQQIVIQLAYYPPYHSKYNPIERVWGVLENHWNGELLSSVGKALGLARSMTYRGLNPIVKRVSKVYSSGVRLTKKAMKEVEAQISRMSGLEKWFLTIFPDAEMG